MLFIEQSNLKKSRFVITKTGEACVECFETRSHDDTEKHGVSVAQWRVFINLVHPTINPAGIQAPLSFQTPVRIVCSVVQVPPLLYYMWPRLAGIFVYQST